MKALPLICALASLSVICAAQSNPFFVFDNGTGRDQKVPYADQAEMVRKAGYAGINFSGTQRIPEMLKELDSRGLKMFSIYVAARLDGEKATYDPGIPAAVQQLKGRDTVLWLTVQGKSSAGDGPAVQIVREIADLARAQGLRVVLYPHAGYYVETVSQALRLRDAANRPNIGVSFNLAHFLAADDATTLQQRLQAAAPHLELVSINGADGGDNWRTEGWSHLIQTLDRGSFDVAGLLRTLRKLGYTGPIGLQCYQVAGDIEENLQRSMEAWKKIDQAAK